jgi:hypothetical protein
MMVIAIVHGFTGGTRCGVGRLGPTIATIMAFIIRRAMVIRHARVIGTVIVVVVVGMVVGVIIGTVAAGHRAVTRLPGHIVTAGVLRGHGLLAGQGVAEGIRAPGGIMVPSLLTGGTHWGGAGRQ